MLDWLQQIVVFPCFVVIILKNFVFVFVVAFWYYVGTSNLYTPFLVHAMLDKEHGKASRLHESPTIKTTAYQ